jgi:hypothetical protein
VCATGAWAGEKPDATVTATPPVQAAVKPLTAQQERLQVCSQRARERNVETARLHAWLDQCVRRKTTY